MSELAATPDVLPVARRPGYSYALKNGRLAIDHVLTASEIQLDKGKMTATGVFVSSSIDRVGDRIDMKGIRTENHQRNPVVLWNHGQNPNADMPVGKTEDENGNYLVQIGEHEGIATTVFSQSLPLAVQIFSLIDEKILRAQSIGFDHIRKQPLRVDGRYVGEDLLEIEMVETSWTGIGCNPDALLMAIHKNWDSRPLDPAIRATLEPYAAALKVWSPGATLETKAFDHETTEAASETPPAATEAEPPASETPDDDDSEQARLDAMADIIGGLMAHPGAKSWLAAVQKDWDESRHPRAADGRFGSGGGHGSQGAAKPQKPAAKPKPPKAPAAAAAESPQAKPVPAPENTTVTLAAAPSPATKPWRQSSAPRAGGKQAREAAKNAVQSILSGAITTESHKELLTHLPKLTVPELKQIAAEHNLKCPAKLKGQVLDKLAHHFNSKIIKTGSVDVAKVAATLAPFAKVPLTSNETRFAQADYLTIAKQYGTLAGHRIKELAVDALQAMKELPAGSEERQTFRKKLAGYAWMAKQAQGEGITGQVEPKDGSDFEKAVDRIQLGERLREKHGNGATWSSFLIESIKNEFSIDTPGLTAEEAELPNDKQGRILSEKRVRQAEQIWADLKNPTGTRFKGERLDRALANLRADYGTMTQEHFFRVLPHLRERKDKITPEVIAKASKGTKSFDESKHPRGQPGNAGQFGPGGGGGGASGGESGASKPVGSGSDDKIAAHAASLREKHGDQAHQKITDAIAALKGSNDPQAAAKVGVLEKVAAHLKGGEKPADEVKPDAPKPNGPKHGMQPGNVPNRSVRYENDKPVKIYDVREGDLAKETPDQRFITDTRPGIVRSETGDVLMIQVPEKGPHDTANQHGMIFRSIYNGDFAHGVYDTFDTYFEDLGDQLVDGIDDLYDEDGNLADPDSAQETITELRGHLETAKREITDLFVSKLNRDFSDVGDHAEQLQAEISEKYDELGGQLDELSSAIDGGDVDEISERLEEVRETLKYLSSDAHDKYYDHSSSIESELEERERQEEDDAESLANELDEVDFEEAKQRAREYNQGSRERDGRFIITFDKDDGVWRHVESQRNYIAQVLKGLYFASIDETDRRQFLTKLKSRRFKNTSGWDESRHPRAQDGRFGSGGGHSSGGGGGESASSSKPTDKPAEQKPRAGGAVKQAVSALVAAAKKGVEVGGKIEHGLVKRVKGVVSKLPRPVQAPVIGIWKLAITGTYTAGLAAVKSVAAERGNTPEQVERIAGICSAIDVCGAKGGPFSLGKLGMAKATAGLSGFVPLGSVGYLAFSTAMNPMATWRAAKKAVAGVMAKGIGATAREIGRDLITLKPDDHGHKSQTADRDRMNKLLGVMLDMVKTADDPDVWAATFHAALDAVGGDVVKALKVTRAALRVA